MYAKLVDELIDGTLHRVVSELVSDAEGAVLCGQNVQVGDIYAGGAFLPGALVRAGRPARTKADAAADKTTQVEDLAREKRISIAGDDSSKLDTYTIKYEVATAALAGNQQAIALLTPEATARGENVAELATLVKQLGDQWRYVALMIDAAYQTHKAALQSMLESEAFSVMDIDKYDYSTNWPV